MFLTHPQFVPCNFSIYLNNSAQTLSFTRSFPLELWFKSGCERFVRRLRFSFLTFICKYLEAKEKRSLSAGAARGRREKEPNGACVGSAGRRSEASGDVTDGLHAALRRSHAQPRSPPQVCQEEDLIGHLRGGVHTHECKLENVCLCGSWGSFERIDSFGFFDLQSDAPHSEDTVPVGGIRRLAAMRD